jgi:trans-aconitate 2-methyltransferase
MWNPDRYERFREERSRPFFDLLDLVRPKPAMRVVDLGCGTGALTRAMHERLDAKETLGVDSSAEMLARAAEHAKGGLRFERGDAGTFEADHAYDLVFSNACLQWIEGHDALFARLARAVAAGGQLAVQMPANVDHPTHVVARAIAREEPFAARVAGKIRSSWPVLAPETYATLLYELGFAEQHVRLQVYAHELASRDDVVTWVEGTLLTEYQAALGPDLWPTFLARYKDALLPRLKDTHPYFYPFKRVLLWAQNA